MQSANGGPIIAVQVENEYGSFGSDHDYMEQIHHLLLDPDSIAPCCIPRTAPINCPTARFRIAGSHQLRQRRSKGRVRQAGEAPPQLARACAENTGMAGLTIGAKNITPRTQSEARELQSMLEQGYSVNLYMFHGGTSFGWMNGANIDDGKYDPDVTSYDYDVPVSESGELRPKYFLFRDVIREVNRHHAARSSAAPIVARFCRHSSRCSASVWDALPKPVTSSQILSMEDVGQSYGLHPVSHEHCPRTKRRTPLRRIT